MQLESEGYMGLSVAFPWWECVAAENGYAPASWVYAYLIMSTALLLVWLVLYGLRSDLRDPMLRVSLVTALLGSLNRYSFQSIETPIQPSVSLAVQGSISKACCSPSRSVGLCLPLMKCFFGRQPAR